MITINFLLLQEDSSLLFISHFTAYFVITSMPTISGRI